MLDAIPVVGAAFLVLYVFVHEVPTLIVKFKEYLDSGY